MSLGSRLKKERDKKGWSQLFVAEKIGITNTVLSNYERDYRDPDTETLKHLADLYEVSIDYLLGRTDEPNSPIKQKNDLDSSDTNIAYFGGTKKDLTEEEAQHLEESLEMFRALKAKRNAEKNK
jgi:transcriptional regulator with XRE-family HTH domain